MSEPRPVSIGILGCADIARRSLAPAFAAAPTIRLRAVASRDADRAAAFAASFECDAVSGYAALLKREDIDAVYIPLPTGLHEEWTRRALAAGKHVFVEKSLTTSARGARELVEAASARGLALVENFMFLHHARHRRVLQLLDAGVVGEPHVVTSAFGIPPRRADDIRYAADLGGGALLDVGAYPARAALSFLGPDLAVAGASLRHDATRGVDVAGAATLHTPAGACAQIAFGFEHYYQCRYEIWGSAARLIVDRAFTAPASLPSVIRVERQNHVEEFTLPPDDQVANAVRAFAALVRGEGDRAEQYAAALRQAELLEAIATSAAPDQPSADLPSGVEHVR